MRLLGILSHPAARQVDLFCGLLWVVDDVGAFVDGSTFTPLLFATPFCDKALPQCSQYFADEETISPQFEQYLLVFSKLLSLQAIRENDKIKVKIKQNIFFI